MNPDKGSSIQILGGRAARPLLREVVRLHRQELKAGFLSSLGDRALGLMFEFAAVDPAATLLVARDARGKVAGFLLGSVNTSAFYRRFLMRKSLLAAVLVAPKLLLSPSRIRKVLETLWYPAKKDVRVLPPAELMDLVVAAEFQRRGVGRKLFDHFVRAMAEREVTEFRITTGGALAEAHQFYERMGAVRAPDIAVHANQVTRVYLYAVSRPRVGAV